LSILDFDRAIADTITKPKAIKAQIEVGLINSFIPRARYLRGKTTCLVKVVHNSLLVGSPNILDSVFSKIIFAL
jgi:hypothetical protein